MLSLTTQEYVEPGVVRENTLRMCHVQLHVSHLSNYKAIALFIRRSIPIGFGKHEGGGRYGVMGVHNVFLKTLLRYGGP